MTLTRRKSPPDPRRRRRAAIVGLTLAPLLALAFVAASLVWMISTEPGARFVLERVGDFMPGEIELGRVSGPIRGPLRLEGVVYEREGMRLEVDRLDLRWRARALLRRQLDIEQLSAAGVRLTTQTQAEPDRPFELPQIDLPVNLSVRQADVRDATIAIGNARPIQVRSGVLETVSRGDALRIQRFDLDSPDLALEVSGSFTPLGAYPVDLDVAWGLQAPDGRRYRGAGSLDGTLEDLVVRQRLSEPFVGAVEARLLDPLDDLRFDGGIEASGVALRELDPAWPELVVAADLAASGSIDDLRAKGQLRVQSDEYGTIDADLAVAGGGRAWRIERLDLRSDRGPTIAATGTVALDEPPRFDLEAGWSDLRWPLDPASAATLLAPSGSLRARGTVDDYRVEGGLRAVMPAFTTAPRGAPLAIDARLAIAGDRAGARIERFDGSTLGGRVSATGTLGWTPAIEWRIALRADDVRPSSIEPRLEGALDLAARTEGRMSEGGPRGSAAVERVAGRLNGQPVSGAGRVQLRGEQYDVRDVRLVWGDAALAAAGSIGETLDLRFTLQAPDLGPLLPDAAGSLSLDGTVSGPRASPALRAKVVGRSLAFGTMRAKAIAGVVSAGVGPDDPFAVSLTGTDLGYGERDFPRARVRAEGTRAAHTLAIAVDGREPPLDHVEVQARGGLFGRQWRGTVERAAYTPIEQQEWKLLQPAAIVVGGTLVQLDAFCLGNHGQRACVTAAVRGAEDWTVEATAERLALDRLSKLYREDLDLRGSATASLSAVGGAGGSVRGHAEVRSAEGTFVVPGESELAGRRAYRGAIVRLVAGAEGTRGEASVEMVDVGSVEGFVELPRWSVLGMPPDDQPLRGRFTARASSLEPVLLVSDTFARPRGRLDVDLTVAGTVGAPRLQGAAHLADASAFVVPLGITVRDVKLDAVPSASGDLTLSGSLRSGDGVLEVRGSAPLDPKKTLASIELSGEDVVIMDLPDRHVEASTDELSVVWTADGIEATGEVRIPRASIELGGEEEAEAISASSDVVFVRVPPGAQRDETGGDLPLRARVRLLFGDDVRVSGSGLEADLLGNLLVFEEPGSETRATGELDLSGGSFAAYGARLEIERGRLVFAESPVTSPAVDLRASREVGDVTAGVDASGTLDNPRVVLWSEPPMPQAEQLSYLVLGRPLSDVGAQEGDTLTRAAQTLGLRGGRYLAKRMGSLFGLEEARIDTGEGGFEQASLVLGKFLSPRLYVAYGVGLFEEGTNSILVRYLLSKKLTLEASTGEQSEADILYVVETGKGEARPKLEPGLPDRD